MSFSMLVLHHIKSSFFHNGLKAKVAFCLFSVMSTTLALFFYVLLLLLHHLLEINTKENFRSLAGEEL